MIIRFDEYKDYCLNRMPWDGIGYYIGKKTGGVFLRDKPLLFVGNSGDVYPTRVEGLNGAKQYDIPKGFKFPKNVNLKDLD